MKDRTILIQGALDIEIEYIVNSLSEKKFIEIEDYEFYTGKINNINIIVSKTLIGTINSTIATCLAIFNFSPDFIINQGIAGSHRENIHIGDIILGEKCCNINAYKMPAKNKGEGSNPFEWTLNKRAKDVQCANDKLVNYFEEKLNAYSKRQVFKGVLGSGDISSKEYDRIIWINKNFDNLSEDMESIGTYSVCNKFNVPCIGIRIISNNELLLEPLNKEISIELQKILVNILSNI